MLSALCSSGFKDQLWLLRIIINYDYLHSLTFHLFTARLEIWQRRMNAEQVITISDAFDVTAVPYLVLTHANVVLETVSGSDAAKVRSARTRRAASSGTLSVLLKRRLAIPRFILLGKRAYLGGN